MPEPLVSVIIPCYNQARFISKCVNSLLTQSYQNLEIIVINDGSPDNIRDVMQQYTDELKVKLIAQENKGVSTARNVGIAAASGKYIQLVDADDWLPEDKIQRHVKILEDSPDVGFVYSDFRLIQDGQILENDSVAIRCLGPKEPELFNSLWIRNFFPIHSPLTRREWIDRVGGFDAELLGHEDWELFLKMCALDCPVKYDADCLVYYLQHPANSSKNLERMRKTELEVRHKIAHDFPVKVAIASDFATRRYDEILHNTRVWANFFQADLNFFDPAIIEEQSKNISPAESALSGRSGENKKNEYIKNLEEQIKLKNDHIAELEKVVNELNSNKSTLIYQKATNLKNIIREFTDRGKTGKEKS